MTTEIGLVLGLLGATVIVLVTGALRVDVVALIVMVLLPWLRLIEPDEAFVGFSSGAVVSVMAVVIMGHGLDRSGVTQRLAQPLLFVAGNRPRRLRAASMGMVGTLSGFMQNVGAAALFLPVGLRVARESKLPASRLLMPVGFAAILGGTLSMVGCSPLILLNDLVAAAGEPRFELFSVLPIGAALLAAGILVFWLFGDQLLPQRDTELPGDTQAEVVASWSLTDNIVEMMVPEGSHLIGETRRSADIIGRFDVHLLAVRELGRTLYAPTTSTKFAAGHRIAVMGTEENVTRLADEYGLRRSRRLKRFRELRDSSRLGYAELVVAPRAPIVGSSMRDIGFRRRYAVEPLVLVSRGEPLVREFAATPLRAGDTLVVHGPWSNVRAIGADRNFVLATPLEASDIDTSKGLVAAACFIGAIAAAMFGFSLPLCLLTGAIAMVLTGVVSIDDAYRAVSWRTVFLLAGLIPLGMAMERSGAARYIASHMLVVLDGAHPLATLSCVAVLASVFTLFMSNVATVAVLVPLVMDLGRLVDIDPVALALLVGICAQNSFLLPTHQVNALLMAPGGYQPRDYLRAGGLMTLIFLPISVGGVYVLWL